MVEIAGKWCAVDGAKVQKMKTKHKILSCDTLAEKNLLERQLTEKKLRRK